MAKLRPCLCDAHKIPVPRIDFKWKGKERKSYFYFCTSCLLEAEVGENILEAMAKWNDMIKKKIRALKEVNKRRRRGGGNGKAGTSRR